MAKEDRQAIASISLPHMMVSHLLILSRTTRKHNEANGEENRDGDNNNLSWNCGVEGVTDDPTIIDLRESRGKISMLL